jgi:hypothetical protein
VEDVIGERLVLIPHGMPLDLMTALGDLVDAALVGAVLGPGNGRDAAATIGLPEELDRNEAADRLRAATAAIRAATVRAAPARVSGTGTGHGPQPELPEEAGGPAPATGSEAGDYEGGDYEGGDFGGGGLTLGRLGVEDGLLSMGIGGAEAVVTDVVKWLLAVFLPALDAQEATNYLEWQLRVPDGEDGAAGEWFTVAVCRPGGRTPHQLRVAAEAEVQRLRTELTEARVRAELEQTR